MAQSKSKKTIQSAIYKATTPKDKTPKEKHVRVIVTKTFVKDGSNEEIIKALTKRLDKSHWAVVLKSLMIFHRCFKDGDPSFIDSLRTRSGIVFALRKFSTSTAANNAYTLFVKKYAKYLEEKVSVLRLMNLQFEQVKDVCKGIKPPKAFKVVPKLQSQLNALLNCKMRSQHAGINNLISRTYILLLQDSLPLYSHLNDGIHSLLDLFWKMPKKDATRVVDIYKLYVKETDALIGLYEIGRRYVNKLPAVPKAETSIVDQMEEYAKNAPVGDGDYEEEPDVEPSNNLNYLMSTPGGNNSDDEAPAGHDSSGGTSSSDDGDEADPFASFISGTSANPFASFSFNVPTLVQPTLYQPAPVATTQPAFGATHNPFVTSPAAFQPGLQSNPFAAQSGNPFAIAPAVSVTQPALVLSNPGMTTNNPFLTTPATYSQPAVTQPVYNPNVTQPRPGGNPFATNNPFL